MIRVCDAIMGSGKSSAAITYMNENANERFIYITPYLDEAARIKENCPQLRFVEPSRGIAEFGFTKTGHTLSLPGRPQYCNDPSGVSLLYAGDAGCDP